MEDNSNSVSSIITEDQPTKPKRGRPKKKNTAVLPVPRYNPGNPRKIDIGKALTLLKKGTKPSDIAKIFQVTPSAITHALKPFKDMTLPSETLKAFRESELEFLETVNIKLLTEMVKPGKLKEGKVNTIAFAQGNIAKQIALKRGEPTDIVDYSGNTRKIRELEAELKRHVESNPWLSEVVEAEFTDVEPQAESQEDEPNLLEFNTNQ